MYITISCEICTFENKLNQNISRHNCEICQSPLNIPSNPSNPTGEDKDVKSAGSENLSDYYEMKEILNELRMHTPNGPGDP